MLEDETPVPFRRVLRNRIIEILKDCDIFKGKIYNSRVQQLEPDTELPCAVVYALDDDSDVDNERSHHGDQREGTIPLEVQVINETVDGEDWPDCVEFLEQAVINLLRSLNNKDLINDCIKYFTLDSSNISVDIGGDIPTASARILYSVTYDELLGELAVDDFKRIGYKIDVAADRTPDQIASGVFEFDEVVEEADLITPIFTQMPIVTGSGVIGEPLTTDDGEVAGTPPIGKTRQWFRGARPGTPISGATSLIYTPVLADDGLDVYCDTLASNPALQFPEGTTGESNSIAVSSGAVLWTPDQLGSAFDAGHEGDDRSTQTPSTGVSVPMSQWRDPSGNLNHLNQASAPDQPITGSLTLGGLNVIDFSTLKFMDYTAPWTAGDVTVFQVAKLPTSDVTHTLYGGPTEFIPILQSGSASAECVRIDGVGVNGVDLELYVSGTLKPVTSRGDCYTELVTDNYLVSSISGFSSPTAAIQMSKDDANFTTNGSIAESVIVIGAMTTANRQRVEGYLSWKWDGGVSGTLVGLLPGGHPYKSAAPLV